AALHLRGDRGDRGARPGGARVRVLAPVEAGQEARGRTRGAPRRARRRGDGAKAREGRGARGPAARARGERSAREAGRERGGRHVVLPHVPARVPGARGELLPAGRDAPRGSRGGGAFGWTDGRRVPGVPPRLRAWGEGLPDGQGRARPLRGDARTAYSVRKR